MHAIGHAAIADAPVGGGEALRDFVRAELGERLQQPRPMRAARAVGADEFVGNAGQRRVAVGPCGDAHFDGVRRRGGSALAGKAAPRT